MKISLLDTVIPIGNVQKDFENLGQIFESSRNFPSNLILVVDDPLPNSLSELTIFSKMGTQGTVQIIQSSEGNPGGARNQGLEFATNTWTHFCDSDDMPCQIDIFNLFSNTENENIDVIIGSFTTHQENSDFRTDYVFGRNSLINHLKMVKHPGIWRWIIRRDFIGDSRFPSLSMGEDQLFIINLLAKNPRIKFTKRIIYRHVTGNPNSLVGSKKNIGDLIVVLEQILQLRLQATKHCPLIFLMSLRMTISLLKYGSGSEKRAGLMLQLRLAIKFMRIYTVETFQETFNQTRVK